jgi:hypothetical protein
VIPVTVTIGIGGWKVTKEITLIACPHVGDMIDVDDVTVECERVAIGSDMVYVEQTVRFNSEAEADEYLELGWSK